MRPKLFTIGYAGVGVDDVVRTLRASNVEVLIDVRDAPFSRKRDFSKKALAAHLERAGLRYCHLKALGNPKAGRDAARAGDMALYRRLFSEHLESEPARDALAAAADLTRQASACLMCLERDPAQCHRLIVAERIAARTSQTIRHLFADPMPSQEPDRGDTERGA